MENKTAVVNGRGKYREIKKRPLKEKVYRGSVYVVLLIIWQYLATDIGIPLILPTPLSTAKAFIGALMDKEIMTNLFITMNRVIKGFLLAMAIGTPIGFLMGFSEIAEKMFGGLIDSLRQVPIMAWVPLTIIWLGIGEGPTIFMITFAGIFPVILNTMQGVRNISKDYYNAARSMGAGPISIFINIIVPSSLPDVLIGSRIAISSGWMSVI